MVNIVPSFKDDNDRIMIVAMFILSIFFFLFPSLVVILCCKNQISETSYVIAKSIFNFELMLFLLSLVFMIPLIGWLIGLIFCPILMIINIVVLILNLCAIAKNGEVKIPVLYEFI